VSRSLCFCRPIKFDIAIMLKVIRSWGILSTCWFCRISRLWHRTRCAGQSKLWRVVELLSSCWKPWRAWSSFILWRWTCTQGSARSSSRLCSRGSLDIYIHLGSTSDSYYRCLSVRVAFSSMMSWTCSPFLFQVSQK
jgi:hypothetical protein